MNQLNSNVRPEIREVFDTLDLLREETANIMRANPGMDQETAANTAAGNLERAGLRERLIRVNSVLTSDLKTREAIMIFDQYREAASRYISLSGMSVEEATYRATNDSIARHGKKKVIRSIQMLTVRAA